MIKIRDKSVGIWWCDFTGPDGKRVRKSLGTKDKKEAKQLEAKLITGLEDKAKKSYEGITIGEAFKLAMRTREEWLGAKSQHSINQVYGMVEEHFKETCTLSSIDDDSVLEYVEDLQDSGLTASTINKRTSMISVLFDVAIERKKFDGKKPAIVRLKVANGRRRVITPEEEAKAISLCNLKSPYEAAMADLIMVLADTGLRLSEALGIQPRNVNIESRAVLVLDTKNGDDRMVPLTDRTLEALKRRLIYPVFQPIDKFYASHLWAKIRERMGLEHDKEFVLHALRHTYASTLANAGVDSFRLQKVMGHKTITTTQKYVKVSTIALTGLSQIMQDRCAGTRANSEIKGDIIEGEHPSVTHCNSNDSTVSGRNHNPLVPSSNLGFATKSSSSSSELSISYTLNPLGGKYGI